MLKLVVLAGTCAVAVAIAGTVSAITGPQVIRVLEVGTVDVNLDSQGEPKAGDRFYSESVLYAWAGMKRGKRVGRDEVLCTFTTANFERGRAGAYCTAQFFFSGGSITAQAFIHFKEGPLAVSVPVTGGTGVYANATGSIRIRDIGSGDSGNTALTFNLTP